MAKWSQRRRPVRRAGVVALRAQLQKGHYLLTTANASGNLVNSGPETAVGLGSWKAIGDLGGSSFSGR